jgi:hypothetical protein
VPPARNWSAFLFFEFCDNGLFERWQIHGDNAPNQFEINSEVTMDDAVPQPNDI